MYLILAVVMVWRWYFYSIEHSRGAMALCTQQQLYDIRLHRELMFHAYPNAERRDFMDII